MNLLEILIIFYIIWNAVVFFTYGLDKMNSKHNKRRISEKKLLACAFLFGASGAILGMKVLRHKTKHLKFKIGVPLAFIMNFAVIFYFMYIQFVRAKFYG